MLYIRSYKNQKVLFMKKLSLSLSLISLFALAINAQELKQNVIKTSLTSIFLKTYVIDYERALNQNMSFQMGFYYTGSRIFDGDFSGFALTPEFRYYLSSDRTAPDGAYVAPYFRYQHFSAETGSMMDASYSKGNLNIISGGLVVGVQRTFKDKISLEAFIGPAFYSPSYNVTDGDENLDVSLFGTGDTFVWGRAGVNIGFMF